jgi:sn-glycerol 3-phosphate transport system permease protein
VVIGHPFLFSIPPLKKQVIFPNRYLPYLLVFPQITITFIFFLWPSWQALEQSFFIEDAFGFSRKFVFLNNYLELFSDESYRKSFYTTFVFSSLVVFFTMAIGLLFAVAANRVLRSALMYRSTLILPYAVAPALAGVLWYFLMNPSVGIVAYWLSIFNIDWNHYVNGGQAMILVVVASIWRQISYTFLFFVAALQSIPRSLIEAAAIDGSGPFKRFWTITFPLLSPTTFFLLVMNLVYATFDTFGVIHATTDGGPAQETSILVFKVYNTGFIGQDYGSSASQSVILMTIVILLTFFQFRYVERKVVY